MKRASPEKGGDEASEPLPAAGKVEALPKPARKSRKATASRSPKDSKAPATATPPKKPKKTKAKETTPAKVSPKAKRARKDKSDSGTALNEHAEAEKMKLTFARQYEPQAEFPRTKWLTLKEVWDMCLKDVIPAPSMHEDSWAKHAVSVHMLALGQGRALHIYTQTELKFCYWHICTYVDKDIGR